MRKTLFFVGVITLLLGLTLLTVGSFRNVKLELIKKTTESWEVSENLAEGNTYVLDIRSSSQWRDDWTGGGYEESQPVDVVIISPNGGTTKLQAFFYALPPTSSWYKSTFPSLVHVEYGSVDSDSIEVDESYPQVRFTIKRGGIYTARIIEESLYWAIGSPREMIFFKEVFENQNLNPVFLQGSGLVCLFIGFVISAWGASKKEKIKRKKKKIQRISLQPAKYMTKSNQQRNVRSDYILV